MRQPAGLPVVEVARHLKEAAMSHCAAPAATSSAPAAAPASAVAECSASAAPVSAPAPAASVSAAGERIAILTDSCADVPQDVVAELGIRVIPLHINYEGAQYRDRVDIQPEEVYARFSEEIPKTSTPTPAEVMEAFDGIVAEGFTHVLVVTIASGLSHTHDLMRSVASGYANLTCEVMDTKNIALGAGFSAVYAAELAASGVSFAEVVRRTQAAANQTKVFFCVGTLEYLYKGGRIGKVTYSMGTAFDIRPVITCNLEDGAYVTAAKSHGRKASLKKAVALAKKAVGNAQRYRLAVVHGAAPEEAEDVLAMVQEALPQAERIYTGQISPALVVHTGPGLLGIGVQVLDEA